MEPDILKLKLDSVSEKIPKNQWKYFHKRSIRNFILNINLIEGETERENTAEILSKCLYDVEGNFEPNIDYSIYLFNNYLKYIVPEYQKFKCTIQRDGAQLVNSYRDVKTGTWHGNNYSK